MPKTKKRKYNFKKYKSGDPNDPSNPFALSLDTDAIEEEEKLLAQEINEKWIEEKSKNGELEVFRDYNQKLDLLSNTTFYMYSFPGYASPKKEEEGKSERFESFLQDYIDDHIFIKVPYKNGDPRDFYVYAYHIEECNKSGKGNKDYVCDGQAHPSHHLAELKNLLNPYSRPNRKETTKMLKEKGDKEKKERIRERMKTLKTKRMTSPASVFEIYNDPPDITGEKRSLSPNSTPQSHKIEGGKKRKRRKTLKRKKIKRKSMKRKNKK